MTGYARRFATMAMSLCLAVTLFPAKDIVLCIGPNGHIALECAQNGRCIEGPCTPVGDRPGPPGLEHSDSPCRECLSCMDLPLVQGSVAGPRSQERGPNRNVPAVGLSALADMVEDQVPGSCARSLPECFSPPGGGAFPQADSHLLRI